MKRIAVIGSGIAGLSSAIANSKKTDNEIFVITSGKAGKSSSAMAQSGFRVPNHGFHLNANKKRDIGEAYKDKFSSIFINQLKEMNATLSELEINAKSLGLKKEKKEDIEGFDFYSCIDGSPIGPRLIKHLLNIAKSKSNITFVENTTADFPDVIEEGENATSQKRLLLKPENSANQETPRKEEYDKIIIAIGGILGEGCMGKSTNMKYPSYSLHNKLLIKRSARIQYHPFGIANFEKDPAQCLPHLLTQKGTIIELHNQKQIEVADLQNRQETCKWIINNGGLCMIRIDLDGLKAGMYKKYQRYLHKNDGSNGYFLVNPVTHYMLFAERKSEFDDYILVGECAGNSFLSDRPAGMGITQAIASGCCSASL